MNSKKILSLLLFTATVSAAFTGCGSISSDHSSNFSSNMTDGTSKTASSPSFVPSEDAGSKSLSIHFMTARNETDAVIVSIEEIAKNYKNENPDLDFTFEVESIPDRTSYLQKLKILGASDELPEWFDSDPDTWLANLGKGGKTYDINSLYDELGVQDKIFDISKNYAVMNDGSLYLITWQCNAEYFFYHKNMFEAAGITETPKTFDDLLDDCSKLRDAGYTPIGLGSDWPPLRYFAMIPFRMTGNEYIEQAVSGKGSFGSEPGIKAAEFMQNIGQYYQMGWTTADTNTMDDLFTSGQTAMIYNGTWALPDMTDENKELTGDIGYFTMPIYSDSDVTKPTDYFANSGIGTAIRADAMTDQMKDFIKYVIDNYPKTAISHNQIPSFKPDNETMSSLSTLYQDVISDIEGVNQYAKCWDVVIDSASVEPLEKETTNLILGEKTPKEWAANMDQIVADNLAKASIE